VTTIDGATYTYDNTGNRLTKVDNRTNTQSNYWYDKIYQLLAVTQGASNPTTTESYGYDSVGNRQTDLSGTSYSYNNPWNRLDAKGDATYTYDSNGNTLTKTDGTGTTQYTWNYANQLTQVTLPGTTGTVTFKYDPFGRCVQKAFTVNGVTTTTNYLNDGDNVVEEVDAGGNQMARYTFGPGVDHPLSVTRALATSMYQADALGSITSLVNSSGVLTDTYTYDSFGNLTNSSGTTINSYRYTGREYDPETGLYYLRARYYDPNTGRFLNEDPIKFAGGINFYRYVDNNPLNFTDPTGQGKFGLIVGGLIGGWVGGQIGAGVGVAGGAVGGAVAGAPTGPGETITIPGGAVGGGVAGGTAGVIVGGTAGAIIGDIVEDWAEAQLKKRPSQTKTKCENSDTTGKQARCTNPQFIPELDGCEYACEDGTVWFDASCVPVVYKNWGH